MAVHLERRGHVALVTLDRPEARNAVNGDVAARVEAALDEIEADPEIWVGIITGTGPVFCAGADLKAVAAGRVDELVTARGGFAGFVRRRRSKPFVAAVDGPALAGGCEIVLACDLVVAARTASFGLPEVKRSLVAAAGGLFRLPRALPLMVAMEMVLTGDPITAERAFDLGLVNQLVDPGGAVAGAEELAGRVIANAPLAVQASRSIVTESTSGGEEELWERTAKAMTSVATTEDFSEGPAAFIEKRPAVWKGR